MDRTEVNTIADKLKSYFLCDFKGIFVVICNCPFFFSDFPCHAKYGCPFL